MLELFNDLVFYWPVNIMHSFFLGSAVVTVKWQFAFPLLKGFSIQKSPGQCFYPFSVSAACCVRVPM